MAELGDWLVAWAATAGPWGVGLSAVGATSLQLLPVFNGIILCMVLPLAPPRLARPAPPPRACAAPLERRAAARPACLDVPSGRPGNWDTRVTQELGRCHGAALRTDSCLSTKWTRRVPRPVLIGHADSAARGAGSRRDVGLRDGRRGGLVRGVHGRGGLPAHLAARAARAHRAPRGAQRAHGRHWGLHFRLLLQVHARHDHDPVRATLVQREQLCCCSSEAARALCRPAPARRGPVRRALTAPVLPARLSPVIPYCWSNYLFGLTPIKCTPLSISPRARACPAAPSIAATVALASFVADLRPVGPGRCRTRWARLSALSRRSSSLYGARLRHPGACFRAAERARFVVWVARRH